MNSMYILEGGEIFSPDYLGHKNLLTAGGRICRIGNIASRDLAGLEAEVIDASGKYIVPGLVDGHVHICGGGGEGGFRTRTPEISLTDLTTAGVTTVIGLLGTDGTTRTMSNLIAKANGLIEEGLSCWVMTGSYEVPVRTVTGSVTDDIVLIDRIIGSGEIALSDHRSSHPGPEPLAALISHSRIGGMLSGKGGVVIVHMGDGRKGTAPLLKLLEETEIPATQLLPTHMNRNPRLFEEAVIYALKGGYVDFTTYECDGIHKGEEIPASKALRMMMDRGVPLSRISFSSDGQGSLPVFDDKGILKGLGIGSVSTLWSSVRDAVREEGLSLSDALCPATSSPSVMHKLPFKGFVRAGYDADLLLIDRESLDIHTVFAGGRLVVREGEPVVRGTFDRG